MHLCIEEKAAVVAMMERQRNDWRATIVTTGLYWPGWMPLRLDDGSQFCKEEK
jgi:hypothetical protein